MAVHDAAWHVSCSLSWFCSVFASAMGTLCEKLTIVLEKSSGICRSWASVRTRSCSSPPITGPLSFQLLNKVSLRWANLGWCCEIKDKREETYSWGFSVCSQEKPRKAEHLCYETAAGRSWRRNPWPDPMWLFTCAHSHLILCSQGGFLKNLFKTRHNNIAGCLLSICQMNIWAFWVIAEFKSPSSFSSHEKHQEEKGFLFLHEFSLV